MLQNATLCNTDCTTMIATKFWAMSLDIYNNVTLEVFKKIFRTV